MNKVFKKGDKVWSITNWDNKATVCVKQLEIKSFGKIQGTAFNVNTNDMVKHQFYANQIEHLFLVSEVSDIQELAIQKAIEQKAKRIKHFRNCIQMAHYSNGLHDDFYIKSINSDCQMVMDSEPNAIFQ